MKKALYIITLSIFALSCKNEKSIENTPSETEAMAINYQHFGDKITAENALSQPEMIENYKNLKSGDTIQVKFSAIVKEVCPKKGCWMNLEMGEEETMVRFKDYGFFMPKDIAGEEVIVNGKAFVEVMSVEDQRHYAEDGGATPEEVAAITEPKHIFSFEADGVLLHVSEIQ